MSTRKTRHATLPYNIASKARRSEEAAQIKRLRIDGPHNPTRGFVVATLAEILDKIQRTFPLFGAFAFREVDLKVWCCGPRECTDHIHRQGASIMAREVGTRTTAWDFIVTGRYVQINYIRTEFGFVALCFATARTCITSTDSMVGQLLTSLKNAVARDAAHSEQRELIAK